MTLVDLLSTLRACNIKIWVEGERLRYRAQSGTLTSDIREELTKHKADLFTFLKETEMQRVTRAPITRISREAKLLPSINQRRLWFIDQLQPNTAFNSYRAFRIKGSLNIAALEQSFNEIVRRHETLRTTFSVIDGEPLQVITPTLKLRLTLIDLRDIVDATEREAEAEKIVTEEVERPFDLAKGPLVRTHLLCLGTDEHLLLITIHHIVSDRWSMGVLLNELTVLHEAFCNGNLSPLPELPIQYVDFAHWQSQWLQGEVLQQELSHWKERLKGAPEVTELPTDYSRPAVQNFQGGSEPLVISKSLTQALKILSKKQGVTLFMTLLAAVKTLLYRYTGQEDLVLGSPIAGRGRGDVENLIGLFINTLVLRTNLSGSPTFRELLQRVREVALDAYAHQEVPFEKLMEELHLERSLSVTSLFQVMLALQNTPASELNLSDSTVSPVTIKRETALSDLFLSLTERDEGLHGTLSYRTDLFDRATIIRMIGQFEVLLQGIVADPDRPISMLPLLRETETHQLLVQWNDTQKDYPKGKRLHQLFEEQVERTSEAVAAIFGDQQMTYRELNGRANQLAHYLKKLRVGPDVLVGICMERSLEMVVALLGILKAGGAYVPLDPQYPKERLAFLLDDSQVLVLLTQQALISYLPKQAAKVVSLDMEEEAIRTESTENPVDEATGDTLAYVIYTSGSTGHPKGVMISHNGICNRLLWGHEAYHLSDRDRVLHAFSLTFDFATWEIFTSLIGGAQLVVAEPLGSRDSSYLARLIETSKVTVAGFVPSMLNAIIDEPKFELCNSLKKVVCGGETLSVELQERFFAARLDVELQNTYGPTEASIDVTFWVCKRENDSGSKRQEVPIGRPIANTQLYILDSHLQPVPIGVAGELHIDGAGLARGYLNRPDLTAERFIPSPFSDEAGARLYKTGDLARYLPDGNIEFIGRRDNQVKIRGFRIEVGEIEAALAQHSKVQAVVVCAHEYAPGDKRLIGYFVPYSGQAVTTGDLRDFLAQKLPSYMVPSNFVLLEALPLTPSGKVDRKAVSAFELSRPDPEASYAAPRTPIEEMMVEIWADVLKLERIGIQDNFFDLGGHSLLATQLISRTCKAFKADLPLRALFEGPTVAELAKCIEKAYCEDDRLSTTPPIVPVSRDRDLPLSFSQERLWFLDQYEPNSSVYNIRSALRLRGSLDVAALEQSLNEIIRRHESLRTTFRAIDGKPVQLIAPSLEFSLLLVDLTSYPEGQREEETQRLIGEEAGRPFDLAKGPLFRSKLLRVGEDDHLLLLTMHHIVSDGWSMGIFRRELSVLYQAFAKGEPSPLPDLAVQYTDFAVWQRAWLQGEALNSQLSYWKKQLERLPEVVNLPTDRPGLAVQSHQGARESFVLSKDLTEKLKVLSRKQGVTLYMALLASFKGLIYRYTGEEDVVIGSPIAGRNRPEIDGLIGFFVNTLILRSDLSGNPTFRELLNRVREVCLRAYANQDLPFQKLVEALRPKANTGRRSFARIGFVYHNLPRHPFEIPGITVTPMRTDLGIAKGPLTLFMWESQESLAGSVSYSTDLFNAATIGRMIEHFQTLLTAVVADPERRLLDMPPFLEESRSELLEAIHWATEVPSHFEIDERVGCEEGGL